MNLSSTIISIRNAVIASKSSVFVRPCNLSLEFLHLLIKLNYINGYLNQGFEIKVFLKYTKGANCIQKLRLLYKPSYPVYFAARNLWKLEKIKGTYILHTSKGLLTHKKAISQQTGGQAVAYIL